LGVIIKQSIKSTIYAYIGAIIGFVNVSLLMPKLLSTEEIGLINYIISIVLILSQFSSLGLSSLMSRIFPYFRDTDKKHNGFFTLGFSISVLGSIISIALYFVLKPQFLKGEYNSIELENYIFYVIPLAIGFIFLNYFDNFLKAIFISTIGVFLREILTRLLITFSIFLYFFKWIDLEIFVLIYYISYIIPILIMAFYLLLKGEFIFVKPRPFIYKTLGKAMLSISFFGIVSGFSNIAILNIDKYMIERYVGLSGVGVYSITFYFATMILLPARSIQKIATIILSESWKNNDLKNINTIYYKSTITQLIIGSYIFIGIWVNIDNIISILGPEYKSGVYVIFFIGLANMVYMLSGLSAYIITTSKKYIYSSIFMLIMLVLIVITNLIFIPIYGIVGAALASFISMLGVSILRFFFIWKNFAIQPYNFQHLIIIGIVIISYYSAFFIPDSFNPFVNIIIKGTVISLVFALLIYSTKVSEDINQKINELTKLLFKKK